MYIDWNMDLDQLMERMGDVATKGEAKHMRRILNEEGWQQQDTNDIPEAEWATMLEAAVRFAEDD